MDEWTDSTMDTIYYDGRPALERQSCYVKQDNGGLVVTYDSGGEECR